MTFDPPTVIDISRPLGSRTPVWPGDRPFRLDRDVHDGVVLSSFETTCHIGSHVDAPRHLDPTREGVETLDLGRLVGPAEVVAAAGLLLTRESLPADWQPSQPRLLLKTDSHPLGAPVGPGFAALDGGLVHWLADRGVVLVGIDTPSVDPFESQALPAHHALIERDVTWIEGLWLGHVEAGSYTLAALPLPLIGAEAAPLRAVLLPIAPKEPAV